MRPQRRPPLIQYWHAERPPDEVVELLHSFKTKNPDMDHLVFSRSTAAEFIAAHYGGKETAAFEACAVPAMQADYFRYCAGYALGGICADADYRCNDGLIPLLNSGKRGFVLGGGASVLLANGLFGFPTPGHPLLEIAMRTATELIQRRVEAKVGQITGPRVLTSLFCLYQVKSLETARRCAAGARDLREDDLLDEGLAKEVQHVISGRWKGASEVLRAAFPEIDDRGQLTAAFDGVRLVPGGELVPHVVEHIKNLAYKKTPDDWRHARRTLYR